MVQVTRESVLDGVERTIEIPLSDKEYYAGLLRWQDGFPIQDAFPMLTPSEREFIKTGITDDQWQELFGSYDD